MNATVTNTTGMIGLVMNAKGRNRSVYEDKFIQSVDPNGIHVLDFKILHNDVEWRTRWLCKMIGTEAPVEIWLDVDFDVVEYFTTAVEVENENR